MIITPSSRSPTTMQNFLQICLCLQEHYHYSLNVSDRDLILNFDTSESENTVTRLYGHIITSLSSALKDANTESHATLRPELIAALSAILLESIGASATSLLVCLSQPQQLMLLDMCQKSTVNDPWLIDFRNSLACHAIPALQSG